MTGNQYAILEMVRAARDELEGLRAATREQFDGITQRLGAIERGISGVKRNMEEMRDQQVRHRASIDRLAERVERIERHLGFDA